MADEPMVRPRDARALAIWPQEAPLFALAWTRAAAPAEPPRDGAPAT